MHSVITRLTLAVGIAAISLAANAAPVSYNYTGSWDGFHTWNPGQTGDPTLSTTPDGGPEMAIAGVVTFDDGTGVVTGLTMTQVGVNTQNWDLNPNSPPDPQYDTVTLSNFAWHSEGTDLRLDSGTFTCNGATLADCGPGSQYGGNYIGTGGPLATFGPPYALTDWIGADMLDAYGDLLDGPGFDGLVTGNTAVINTLTGWDGFVTLASTGQYNLTLGTQVVPVPAAVWLFGSALGMLGWIRRRVNSA